MLGSRVNKLILVGLFTLSILGGCTSMDGRPQPSYYESGSEFKLKSAAHWRIIATDVSEKLVPIIKKKGLPVFLSVQNSTLFERVFGDQLQSVLVANNVPVSIAKDGAMGLYISTEEVHHKTIRNHPTGAITALAGGVYVAHEMAIGLPIIALGLGDVVLPELDNSKPLDTEIAVSVKLVNGSLYEFHRTDVYYIDEVDSQLFKNTTPPPAPRSGKIFKMMAVD